MQTFRRQGYAATSIRDLGENMGIGRASLYETFGNKDEIFAAALERYRGRSIEPMIEMLAASEDPIAGIRELLLGLARSYARKADRYGCLMVNTVVELGPSDRQVARVLRETWSRLEDALVDAVKRGQLAGLITATGESRALARFLVNTFQGLGVGKKLGPDPAYVADVVDIALSVLTR